MWPWPVKVPPEEAEACLRTAVSSALVVGVGCEWEELKRGWRALPLVGSFEGLYDVRVLDEDKRGPFDDHSA